jgi:hypothetical protein
LDEVVIERAVFELVNRLSSLCSEFFEPHLEERSTANMTTLDTRFTTLAAFKASDLFAFAVLQLLDLPTEAAVASVKS